MALRALKSLIPDRHPLRLLWHRAKAFTAAVRYGFPARKLTVIGVTGTDGKTTTAGMIAHILHENGIRAGTLSTAFFRIGDRVEWNATQKTSPSPFVIQAFLRRLVREGCTHAVLEYSSHGLTQGRMQYTWPQIAGITNVSEEHLDYHGTMDEYVRAKGLLFRMLKKGGIKVLNTMDKTYERYAEIPTDKTYTYGTAADRAPWAMNSAMRHGNTDLLMSAQNITSYPTHTEALIECTLSPLTTHHSQPADSLQLTLPLPGAFNVENALCAIGCAHAAGVDTRQSIAALASFTGIPGRLERIDEGQPFAVFVDFTVTPQSYEHTLHTLVSILPDGKRLLVLTGSCGDRMQEKRPVIGRIVSAYADVTVVTNEDPYTEDPEKIIDEVWAGVYEHATEAHRISDRKEAIAFLLKKAQPGDIVILCGKGSDTTMWVKDGQIPWNERAIVRDMLRNM